MKTLLERIADMAACVEGNVEEVLLDAAKEIKRLQAKIEAVEKQEPVATVDANDEGYWAEILPDRSVRVGQNLYALPGAQKVPSVPKKIGRVESGFKGMFLREAQAYKRGWNECRGTMLAAPEVTIHRAKGEEK